MSCQEKHIVFTIVNWNNYEDTEECISSILNIDYPNYDIVLIDNGSTDRSGARLDLEFSEVETIFAEENLGFAGAHNLGIKWAVRKKAEYIMVLNNDVIIPETTCIGELINFLENDSRCDIVSPRICHHPDIETVWFEKGMIDYRIGSPSHKNEPTSEEYLFNDYVPLAAVLIDVNVFSEVGLLPEKYFLYYEDVDFCHKTKEAGFGICTYKGIELWHKANSSSGESTAPIRSYYNMRNQWLWAQTLDGQINWPRFYVHMLLKTFYQTLRRLKRLEIPGLIALFLGLIDGIRKKEGKGPYP